MKTKPAFFIKYLLLFIIGVLLIWLTFTHKGYFRAYIRGSLGDGLDDGFSVVITGTSRRNFFFFKKPLNFNYPIQEIVIMIQSPISYNKNAIAYWKDNCIYVINNKKTKCIKPLSVQSVQNLILHNNQDSLKFSNFIFEIMEKANKGTLPGPRHHVYSFTEPYRWTLNHYNLGIATFLHVIVAWIIYLSVAILFLAKSRSRRQSKATRLKADH